MLNNPLKPSRFFSIPGRFPTKSLLLALILTACGAPSPTPTLSPPTLPPSTSTQAPTPTQSPTIAHTNTPSEPPTPTLTLPDIDPANAIPHLIPGQNVIITYIDMIDGNFGWAIGGENDPGKHILTTQDGGLTWQDVTPPEPAADNKIATAFFLDTNTAWVTYSYQEFHNIPNPAIIWHTTDAGQTWTAQGPLNTRSTAEFYSPSFFTFADDQNGWLLISVGAGMSHDYTNAYRTQDGGSTWTRIHDPSSEHLQSCCKTNLTFFDTNLGILTAEQGPYAQSYYLITNDSGLTWEHIDLPSPKTNPNLFNTRYCATHSPHIFSPTEWRIGLSCPSTYDASTVHYEYRTTDSGITWATQSYPGGDLFWLSPDFRFALSRAIYQKPTDSFEWMLNKTVLWFGQFDFINRAHGWAVARDGDEIALVSTQNNGYSWQIITPQIIP